jgi:hypothetical protein
MPQVVTGNLTVTASATETVTNALASGSLSPILSVALAFGSGTGALKIQYTWSVSATATASPVTYTLSALTDGLGRSVPLTKVRGLVIAHLGTVDAQPLTVGGAALAGPLATGYVVAAGSSDQLKLDPGINTIPFKIMIMGE